MIQPFIFLRVSFVFLSRFLSSSFSQTNTQKEGGRRRRRKRRRMEGEGAAVWQGAVLGGILFWIVSASYLDVTRKLRSLFQPWVSHHVETQTSVVLKIQVTLKFHPNFAFDLNIVFYSPKAVSFFNFLVYELNFSFWGAELRVWVPGCTFLRVVLRCFCALLHWFSPSAVLGTNYMLCWWCQTPEIMALKNYILFV